MYIRICNLNCCMYHNQQLLDTHVHTCLIMICVRACTDTFQDRGKNISKISYKRKRYMYVMCMHYIILYNRSIQLQMLSVVLHVAYAITLVYYFHLL